MYTDKQLLKIIHAAHDRKLANVVQLLSSMPGVLEQDDLSVDLLKIAAKNDDVALLELLVSNGVDINTPMDNDPEGVIDRAVSRRSVAAIEWLLAHGAKLNHVVNGQQRCFPLTKAAFSGDLDIVKLLLDHGADINATWIDQNALSMARMYGQKEVVDYLLSRGAKEPKEVLAERARQSSAAQDAPIASDRTSTEPRSPSQWFEDTWWPIYAKGSRSYNRLKKPERVIFLVGYLVDQMINGGALQFYFNPSGRWAVQTVEALEVIGATELQEALRAANSCFPDERPAKEDQKRHTQLDELPAKATKTFSKLERVFAKRKQGDLIVVRLLHAYGDDSQ